MFVFQQVYILLENVLSGETTSNDKHLSPGSNTKSKIDTQ